MAKNALNEMKFGSDMYLYGFHKIFEDFFKKFKIAQFLAEKRPFSAFYKTQSCTLFSTKNVSAPSKMLRTG